MSKKENGAAAWIAAAPFFIAIGQVFRSESILLA